MFYLLIKTLQNFNFTVLLKDLFSINLHLIIFPDILLLWIHLHCNVSISLLRAGYLSSRVPSPTAKSYLMILNGQVESELRPQSVYSVNC